MHPRGDRGRSAAGAHQLCTVGVVSPFGGPRQLGRFGPEAAAAVPMLEKALQNEDSLYRVQAALALWKILQHPQAIPTLRAALKRNESDTASRPCWP